MSKWHLCWHPQPDRVLIQATLQAEGEAAGKIEYSQVTCRARIYVTLAVTSYVLLEWSGRSNIVWHLSVVVVAM